MNFLKKFFRHPWAIIIICLACTGFFGYFIKNLQMDNSLRQFFPQKDESYDRMNATEDTFGSMLSIGIVLDAELLAAAQTMLKTRDGIFRAGYLHLIAARHHPHIRVLVLQTQDILIVDAVESGGVEGIVEGYN